METIRSTIRQFDKQHPELAIFPDMSGPLTEAQKTRIYQAFKRGASVDKLIKQFGRTKTTIYRVINEVRAAADHGAAAGLHSQPAVLAQGRRQGHAWARCRESETPAKKARRPSGLAAVPGQPVRDAAA